MIQALSNTTASKVQMQCWNRLPKEAGDFHPLTFPKLSYVKSQHVPSTGDIPASGQCR